MTKPATEMTPMERYAQKLADLTGRTVSCVPMNRMPRTDFPHEDFFDCLGPITRVYPNDKTD